MTSRFKGRLTETDLRMIRAAADDARLMNIRERVEQKYNIKDGDSFGALFKGFCGEFAVAKTTGYFTNLNVGSWGVMDVGPYEVKTVILPDRRLWIGRRDRIDAIYISVYVDLDDRALTGEVNYELRGWFGGDEAQEPHYLNEKYNVYEIPVDHLHPMDFIPGRDQWPNRKALAAAPSSEASKVRRM